MRLAQNLGNMLDIRKAYANVSRSAMLRSRNYIEVETSNSFETLGADALRAAFSGWAQAVCHDLAEHAHDSDSSDEAFLDAHCALALSPASTLALSPALTLNRLPDHANARCLCPCGCRRRPGRRLLCNLGDRGCGTPIGPGCCTHPEPPPGGEEGLCCRCAQVPQPNPQEIEALSLLLELGLRGLSRERIVHHKSKAFTSVGSRGLPRSRMRVMLQSLLRMRGCCWETAACRSDGAINEIFLLAFIALPPTCRMLGPRKNKTENTGTLGGGIHCSSRGLNSYEHGGWLRAVSSVRL